MAEQKVVAVEEVGLPKVLTNSASRVLKKRKKQKETSVYNIFV